MTRFVKWFFDDCPEGIRVFFTSFIVAATFYFAAFLSTWISNEAAAGGWFSVAIHASVLVPVLTLAVVVGRLVDVVHGNIEKERHEKFAALMVAHARVNRLEMDALMDLRSWDHSGERFVESFAVSVVHIQRVVQAAYLTFEGAFGAALPGEDRIDFEVTFMTRSYKDNEITVPAAANREGRGPRSMLLRAENPRIYDNSVTAQLYRDDRPSMRIVEDTASEEYHELYEGQKERIKSSIVFPVLSDANELLGTMVVHCDRAEFFLRSEEKYWTDMLEVFSKRVALVKARMDKLVELAWGGAEVLEVPLPSAPF